MGIDRQIENYISLLKTYNEHTNVYSKKAYDHLPFHISDCKMLASLIGDDLEILDMGSGSGLPSVILSICKPSCRVTAVESKSRKTKFLDQIKDDLELHNLTIVNSDIHEYIHKHRPRPQIITAKAFAPYDTVIKITQKVASKGSKLFIPISDLQFQTLSLMKLPSFKLFEKEGFRYLTKGY